MQTISTPEFGTGLPDHKDWGLVHPQHLFDVHFLQTVKSVYQGKLRPAEPVSSQDPCTGGGGPLWVLVWDCRHWGLQGHLHRTEGHTEHSYS